jgi:hypothetical protein
VTPEERAAAIVRPSVVYLEIYWAGWVRDLTDGQLWNTEAIEVSSSCSGFFVSNDGFIVTAGHCVDPGIEGVASSFYEQIVFQVLGEVSSPDALGFYQYLAENSTIEGETADSPAIREVYVQQGVALSGLRGGASFPARVVDFNPVSQGDVALLKVEDGPFPAVEVAPTADLQVGTPLLAIGYPGTANQISDETLEPSNKDGKISNRRTEGGVPFYEISAATTGGMSGGPVADLEGNIIGLVSHGPARETQAFNFISASSLIAQQLAQNAVQNTLGPLDVLYREGLDAYYSGHYTDAINKFDAVLAMVPSHQQAQEFKQLATQRRAVEGDAGTAGGGTLLFLILIGVAIVVVVAVILLVVFLARRNRKPTFPTPMSPVIYAPVTPALPAAPAYPPYGAAAPVAIAPPMSAPPVSAPPMSAPPVAAPPTIAPPVGPPVSAPPPAAGKFCPRCGSATQSDAQFCPRCGSQLS